MNSLACLERVAVIEVDGHGDLGVLFDDHVDDGLEIAVLGVFAGPSEICRIRGAFSSAIAWTIPWVISMLLTLKAPTA